MKEKVKAGIIGAAGYGGAQIARILLAHPDAELVFAGSRSNKGTPAADVYGNLRGRTQLLYVDDNMDGSEEAGKMLLELADSVDVIFTATPQGACAGMMSEALLERCRIIDLSADFRLKDVSVYEKWYKIEHKAPQYLAEAVYGLTEINREKIRDTRILANPGCYTTSSILACLPPVADGLIDTGTLVVDALSGVSGAGRGAKTANLYCEVNESAKAYGVTNHRHTPEIEEQLSYAKGAGTKPVTLTFTPHLVPMNRGILVTAYASLTEKALAADDPADLIRKSYEQHYGSEYFIRLLGEKGCPETRFVEGSNYVDIGFAVDKRCSRLIMMSALDNLMKGAASQAVQNMNVMFGLDEKAGIDFIPDAP
ncbi:MAG: N-acetyl-gamma-glutamyl-phosphate reductase [Lachnospiraceae bacterium]|nr:N-acetyl-gamma-glutamyl-phosphate reductase [Lachnospiraceae bacterium]